MLNIHKPLNPSFLARRLYQRPGARFRRSIHRSLFAALRLRVVVVAVAKSFGLSLLGNLATELARARFPQLSILYTVPELTASLLSRDSCRANLVNFHFHFDWRSRRACIRRSCLREPHKRAATGRDNEIFARISRLIANQEITQTYARYTARVRLRVVCVFCVQAPDRSIHLSVSVTHRRRYILMIRDCSEQINAIRHASLAILTDLRVYK